VVARWAHNPEVKGSNPFSATKINIRRNKMVGIGTAIALFCYVSAIVYRYKKVYN